MRSAVALQLWNVSRQVRNIRDSQEEIPCDDEDACLCNEFDRALDILEGLAVQFEESNE